MKLFIIIFGFSGLVGCATGIPEEKIMTEEEKKVAIARFEKKDLGYLKNYLGQSFSNDEGSELRIYTVPEREIIRFDILKLHIDLGSITVINFNFKPLENGRYELVAGSNETLDKSLDMIGFFDDKGIFVVEKGPEDKIFIQIKNNSFVFSYKFSNLSHRKKIEKIALKKDFFHINIKKNIPISSLREGEYKKYTSALKNGVWGEWVGKKLVGETDQIEIKRGKVPNQFFLDFIGLDGKTVNGQLPLYLDNRGRMDLPKNSTNEFNWKHGWYDEVDSVNLQMTNNKFINTIDHLYYLRSFGDRIKIYQFKEDRSGKYVITKHKAVYYFPFTKERLEAARLRLRDQQQQAREVQERERVARIEREANRRRTSSAILQGFSQGLASAQAQQRRMEEDFDRSHREVLRLQREAQYRQDSQRAEQDRAHKKIGEARKQQSTAQSTIRQTSRSLDAELTSQQIQQKNASLQEPDMLGQKAGYEPKRVQQLKDAERKQAKLEADRSHQAAVKAHLNAEKNGIRLGTHQCLGRINIIGKSPSHLPVKRVVNCMTVEYEALCPGQQNGYGYRGSWYGFSSDTMCSGKTLPADWACSAAETRVRVVDVKLCGGG